MLRNTQIDFRRNNGAQQGARANDHGCHDPCSEQHGSRQPRSWLILNVSQEILMSTAKTFADLGTPFRLFEAPISEASEFVGAAVYSLCGRKHHACFELGIGCAVM